MKISMYSMTIETFVPVLESLDKLLERAEVHAKQHQLDLINARLAPDMFTLAQQVQMACYQARNSSARLSRHAGEPSSQPGRTFAELRADIAASIAQIRRIPAARFEGSEALDCTVEPPNAQVVFKMDGLQFLRAWALPHFYFHVVTAYDILRHSGLDIGKKDFVSWAGAFMRPKG